MKKLFFLAAAMVSTMFASAQTIYSLGFEKGEESTTHSSKWALTPGKSQFGDWVNVHDKITTEEGEEVDGDMWIEQSEEAAHSGQYGLYVLNCAEGSANSWDRGFKVANLPIKENTPYRVSFWVKGPAEGKLSSWLSVGMENFDKSFCTAGNDNYGCNQITLSGEWQHVSFVSVYHGKEAIKTVIDGQSWVGNAVFPEAFGGNGTETYKEHFGGYIPEDEFFAIFNLNSEGEYFLDDIKIEENVTYAGVAYSDIAARIDLGFPTNIAELVSANGGNVTLAEGCVTIVQGSSAVNVASVEAVSDGYIYAFFPEGEGPDVNSTDDLVVSFNPPADCGIVYNGDKRPDPTVTEDIPVKGFEAVVADYDATVDARSALWVGPEMVSVVPENNSFNLVSSDFKEVVVTFNKLISLNMASATLSYSDNFGAKTTDLSNDMKIGEDGYTLVIPMPANLADNQYVITINGVANENGLEMDNDIKLTYEIGEDTEAGDVEVMYKSDFNNDTDDCVPVGWYTLSVDGNGNDMVHTYGFTDSGTRFNYGWGGNPGGGGARLYGGFSGDFTKALYWCSRDTEVGYCSFGELIKDYMNDDGTVDEASLPDGVSAEDLSLYLTPGKYNVSFAMAAWKAEPKFMFTVVNIDDVDNPLAQFIDYKATPNMNGSKGKVSGIARYETDFTVETEGYYAIRFEAQKSTWSEYLLSDVQVITMPSKAAYYNGLLAAAREKAEDSYYNSLDYDKSEGTSADQQALNDEISYAEKHVFQSPSEVTAEIAKLEALAAALDTRVENIMAILENMDTAKEGLEALTGTKYENVDAVVQVAEVVAKYGDVDPSDMTDAELAEVAPILSSATAKLANVESCSNILTAGIQIALATAETLGVDDEALFAAADNAVDDDRAVATAINNASKMALYKQIVAGTWKAEENLTTVKPHEMKIGAIAVEATEDTEAYEIEDWINVEADSIVGIDFTGYIANPKFYRVNGVSNAPGWTVAATDEEKTANIGWNGSPSDAQYVVDGSVSIYGNVNFNLNQSISGLPVGKYAYVLNARTPYVGTKIADYGKVFYYNAQNDSTQMWDMYLYANIAGETLMTPVNGCSGLDANSVAAVREVTVGEDGVLTIGVVENYTSGVAETHESGEATDGWLGTFYADNASLYFVAPLDGYDYAGALKNLETAIETVQPNATVVDIYSINGVRMAKAQKGVNIVKMSNGKVVKVLVK